jgi:hypothetical protein
MFVLRSQKKKSFNAGYFVDYVLIPIAEFLVMHTAASQKQKACHSYGQFADIQVKIHHSKSASMRVKLSPHPPYSPDMAPSDFFLFGYIKQKIAGQEFVSLDDLLEAIREEFGRLSKSFLESVFYEWLIRLQNYLDYQDSYFAKG